MKATLKILSIALLQSVVVCLLFSILLASYPLNSNHILLAEVPLEMPLNYEHTDSFEESTKDIEVDYLIDLAIYLNSSEKYQIVYFLRDPIRLSNLEIPKPPPDYHCI